MNVKGRKFVIVLVNAVLLFLLFILRYSGLMVLSIGDAVPVTFLPLIAAIACFFGEWVGCTAGFAAGILMDSAVNGASCFNTITLMLTGLICGVLSTYFFNKNIKTAGCLSLGSSFFYFFLRYLFFFVFKGIPVGGEYLYSYLLPSAVYTALFIIPFYFIEKKLKKLYEKTY